MRDQLGYCRPAGTEYGYGLPVVGQLVYFQGRAVRVMHVKERDDDQVSVTLRRVYGPKLDNENTAGDAAYRAGRHAWASNVHPYTSERVPLCSCHGHPYPCREGRIEKYAEEQSALLEERIAKVGTSICYACGEVITTRQGSTGFPEPNIEVPGAPPPRFHTRRKCFGDAVRYERKRRTLLKLEPALDMESGGLW